MLHVNDLSYRIEGRPIFEAATAGIPTGHKAVSYTHLTLPTICSV